MVIDMIIVCVLSVFLEYKLLKGKYMFFSPFTNFNISFFVVYLFPIILFRITPDDSYFSLLSLDVITKGYMYIRVFYYTWWVLSMLFFLRLRKHRIIVIRGMQKVAKDYLFFIWFVMFGLYFIAISAPLGFNLSLTFSRLINPRAFTYIRSGYGPINHILNAIKLIMLILSAYLVFYKKSYGSLLLAFFSLVVNILGGSKTSFVNFAIVYALISNKMDFQFKKVNLFKLAKYGVLGLILLLIAFMVFYKPGEIISLEEALEGLKGYQKEAYYTINVINDFEWDIKFLFEGILDTITPFIPRAIWGDKPYSGFYQRYWRMIYEPNTVLYHTSTFGTLAEAFMMFGYIGAFIYAIFFYIICKKVFLYYQKTNTFYGVFVSAYIQCGMYFLVRSGLFSSTIVAMVYQSFIAYLLLVIIQKLFRKESNSLDEYTSKKL